MIAAYAAAHPDLEWIEGGGWSLADFPGGVPRREDLDRIVPDRPVFLPNRDGHDAWVNSAALERAGITKPTPPTRPPAGSPATPDGTPVGTLHEGAMDLVGDLVPTAEPTPTYRRAILESQRYLHGLGITNWQDAWVEPPTRPSTSSLGESGELTARVVGALWWERARGARADRRARRAAANAGPPAATRRRASS